MLWSTAEVHEVKIEVIFEKKNVRRCRKSRGGRKEEERKKEMAALKAA